MANPSLDPIDDGSETGRPEVVPASGNDVEVVTDEVVAEPVAQADAEQAPEEAEEAEEGKVQRRIDRLTAKRHEAEARADAAERELRDLREKAEQAELEAYRGMPDAFVVQALRSEERASFKSSLDAVDKFGREADAWARGLSEGLTTGNGREFSSAECARYYRDALRDQAKAEAKLNALREVGSDRLREHLRKTGFRVGDAAARDEVSPPVKAQRPQVQTKRAAAEPLKAPSQGGTVPADGGAVPQRQRPITDVASARELLGLDVD